MEAKHLKFILYIKGKFKIFQCREKKSSFWLIPGITRGQVLESFAFSKWAISGRGKEKGIQVGDVLYQEMAKNMLYITVGDKEKDEVVDIIINSAKSGQYGHYGDGKIFVSDISEAYTISEETREDDDE